MDASDRRGRNGARDLDGLGLWLESGTGQLCPARIGEWSGDGASLQVAAPVGRAEGEALHLVLCTATTESRIRVPVRVRHVTALADHWRYSLEFQLPGDLREELPPALQGWFCRRAAAPRPFEEVRLVQRDRAATRIKLSPSE